MRRSALIGSLSLLTGALLLSSAPALAAVFVVDSAGVEADDNLGDDLCHTAANTCTLPAAMAQANATAGSDTIQFAIPGPGVHTIAPPAALPTLLESATIDGTTQPGYSGTPLIELDGTSAGSVPGLLISTGPSGGGSVTVRGLAINRFGGAGIHIQTGAGHLLQSNFLGTDATGTIGLGNGTHGILLVSGAGAGVQIGGLVAAHRNVISGNGIAGISLTATGTLIQGNFVGTDVSGAAAIPNGGGGIVVSNQSSNTLVGGIATSPGLPPGNLVSGNTGRGITIAAGAAGAMVEGNLVGTDAGGMTALPNADDGIYADTNATIGGLDPGARNVISGNGGFGVEVRSNVSILGNYIGTDITGSFAIGNGSLGVRINGGNSSIVGLPGAGNLVSGNGSYGVEIRSGSTLHIVQGNLIGTDATGLQPIPNLLDGVAITSSAAANLVGGTGPGEANVIAFNGGAGVMVSNGAQNRISANSIFENGGLGIDLTNNGVTPNDLLDPDAGANDLQNSPVVSSAEIVAPQGAGTRVQGLLHSAASTTYTLEFFSNPPCLPRPREYHEGRTYLGTAMVTTDASGKTVYDVTLPVAMQPGEVVTATATAPNGSTSEFSTRLPLGIAPASGPSAGGTAVTISGQDFEAGATATIGGLPAGSVNVASFNSITGTTPALAAGTVNDVIVTNTDGSSGTLAKGWVADFLDVPGGHPFHAFVTTLVSNAITVGIGGGLYGVNDNTLRQQMAVFLLKGKHGLCYTPPGCTGVFPDVACPSTFANWIEALAAEGITGGCGGGNYCPQSPVRRDQMAVFLLKAEHGSSYAPPPCAGTFADVTCPSTFANWIEQLAAEMITGGCGGGNYCPLNNNTRGQMAVFITKTFNLQ